MMSFQSADAPTPSNVFNPVPIYLFSATVKLGKPLAPIPLLEGGMRIVEPITGGTIAGPGFMGTFDGGVAVPILLDSHRPQIQIPIVYAYGHADDGSPFYIEEDGIGSRETQTSRLKIEVGGKYEALRKMYIIAQPTVNEDRTIAQVECFSMPLPPPSMVKE